jgi:hypothetical protein
MITSGRRAKRPDGAVYRRMRRQSVAGRTLLETAGHPRRGGGILQAATRSLTVLLDLLRRR